MNSSSLCNSIVRNKKYSCDSIEFYILVRVRGTYEKLQAANRRDTISSSAYLKAGSTQANIYLLMGVHISPISR